MQQRPPSVSLILHDNLGYATACIGKRSPVRFHAKNSEGWFRVDLRSGWIGRAEVLFLKPKDATGAVAE